MNHFKHLDYSYMMIFINLIEFLTFILFLNQDLLNIYNIIPCTKANYLAKLWLLSPSNISILLTPLAPILTSTNSKGSL